MTTSQNEQRGQLVGLAKAFFARGIPNYIGTAWQVDDACAQEMRAMVLCAGVGPAASQ